MATASSGQRDILKDLMECAVCLSQVQDHRALPCQHLFCQHCLEPLLEDRALRCPVCRKICRVDRRGVAGLPKNPLVVKIIENTCVNCEERVKATICQHCNRRLCSTCIKSCSEQEQVDDTNFEEKSVDVLSKGREHLAGISEQMADFNKEILQMSHTIDSKAEAYIEAIKKKQKHLKDELQDVATKEMDRMSGVSKKLSENLKELERIVMIRRSQTKDRINSNDANAALDKCEKNCQKLSKSSFPHKLVFEDVENVDINFGEIKPVESSDGAANGAAEAPTDFEMLEENRNNASLQNQQNTPLDYHFVEFPRLVISELLSRELNAAHVAVCPLTLNIVICDSNNSRVCVCDRDGDLVTVFGSSGRNPGEFNFGTHIYNGGINVSPTGCIVVADTGNHRIQVFSEIGEFIMMFGKRGNYLGDFVFPTGVCTSATGEIYIVDSGNKRIQVFTSDGSFLKVFGDRYEMDHWNPVNIAVWPDGDVVVSNWRKTLEIFDRDGTHLRCYNTTPHGEGVPPCGVSIDTKGNIVTSLCNGDKILVLSRAGEFISIWGALTLNRPVGVACSPDGRVLVVNSVADVHVY